MSVVRFIGSFFGAIFTAITLGLLFGALTVGAIFWIYSTDLPSSDSLAQYTPPTISRIYSREGRIIDEFAQERRLFVPIEDIPDLVKFAFVSAEDKHFFTHKGYDITGMVAALVDAITSRGANVRGASTITQQVMKNFLLDGSRSLERKVKEIILASRLEGVLSKGFISTRSIWDIAALAQLRRHKPISTNRWISFPLAKPPILRPCQSHPARACAR
jgi:penicillin-binding protein 1A